MKVICAWCKETIEECKPGTEGDDRISHGVCQSCEDRERAVAEAEDYININP